MPIFHDHYDRPPRKPTSELDTTTDEVPRPGFTGQSTGGGLAERLHSENAMGTIRRSDVTIATPGEGRAAMLSRGELIERIKRGQSPSWPAHQNYGRNAHEISPPPTAPRQNSPLPLLPAAEFKEASPGNNEYFQDQTTAGLQIERPKSALHAGDFRQEKDSAGYNDGTSDIPLAISPVAPWHPSFPRAAFSSTQSESQYPLRQTANQDIRPTRSRATSHSSLSSSFVLMPPTSPLVQQSNNTDLDFSPRPRSRQVSRSPETNNRRHTFSPYSFQTYRSSPIERPANSTPAGRPLPANRREGMFPYQAHQPRRSLTSIINVHPYSTPQTPLLKPRRPSISSECSPLHHAPMVGSYEESILRGRMSTTPSRPLNFVAQIGVLGKGQCKPNLRCPPHVTVPFPAVFYSYNSGNGKLGDDSPSPYVGLIDLENSLPPADEVGDIRRRRRYTTSNNDHDIDLSGGMQDDTPDLHSKAERRRREKIKRRSTSPKAPPGGSYRIPQTGQLQIVIKNPNKTAVKLFLVPYDLADMEPGQKTFIRQRSYSAGPIIDMPLASRTNLGTDRPEASLSTSDDPNDRPILRYLIHLHICCTSKGRYFLYKSIRVVFANRVPDGTEKLRNEVQLPEPRYSVYKPTRDAAAALHATSSAAAALTAEKAFRRRSAGFSLSHNPYDHVHVPGAAPMSPYPFPPIPFSLSRLAPVESRPPSREQMDLDGRSPFRSRAGTDSTNDEENIQSPGSLNGAGFENEKYDKLNKGDAGYGGAAFGVVGMPGSGAGLLTRRLKGLDGHMNGEDRDVASDA